MVRQNTFSHFLKSFSQFDDQIKGTEKVLFSYHNINISQKSDKFFQIIHSREKIGINFIFCPLSGLLDKKFVTLASCEGIYTCPAHRK